MSIDALAYAGSDSGLAVTGIGHLAVTVRNIARARDFYCRVLGFSDAGTDVLPGLGNHVLVRAPSGQTVALAAAGDKPDLSDTGVHQAYRAGDAQCSAIAARLAEERIDVHTYKEDRKEEENDNFYFFDPDGNRLQLVRVGSTGGDASGVTGIDHVGFLVSDILWGEHFYGSLLGLPEHGRTGWKTADHARAKRWAAGEEDMAPGTRRLDKLYMTMGGQSEVARANAQIYYAVGGETLAMFLATKHIQEPPETAIKGGPSVALTMTRGGLDRAAEILAAGNWPFEGPVEHPALLPCEASLYFKDPGANFVELCVLRD